MQPIFYIIAAISVIGIIAVVILSFVLNKPPPPATDQPNGTPCSSNTECSSGYCDGTCSDLPCGDTGASCTDNSNCCSQSCGTNGTCNAPDSWISVAGYSITSSQEGVSGTPDDCKTACVDSCAGFTYFDSKTCSNVNSISTVFDTPSATSYIKKKGGQTLVLPSSFVGQQGTSIQASAVSDCDTACKKSSCTAYSFDGSTCWMVQDTDHLTYKNNITSYIL